MPTICFFLSDSHRILVKYWLLLEGDLLSFPFAHCLQFSPQLATTEHSSLWKPSDFLLFMLLYWQKETPGETSFHTAGVFGFLQFMVIFGMLRTFYGFCYKLTDKFHPKVLICQKVTRWACSISTNTKEYCLTLAHFQTKYGLQRLMILFYDCSLQYLQH